MNVNYSDEPVAHGPNAIFLAGPTPRDGEAESWRPLAMHTLRKLGHTGLVYVPEIKATTQSYDYTSQTEWEWEALERADAIAFWVPRRIDTTKKSLGMPAFTTNVEFGLHIGRNPHKVVYGRPHGSEKNRYLDKLYASILNKEPHVTMESLLKAAMERAIQNGRQT